ncbi:MAG: hypothetical protein K0R38_2698 [Polyangiaceae bacterium]|jgi:hypothetical protein|nr:hypothetical protein [Polyangiaceae bacterium]
MGRAKSVTLSNGKSWPKQLEALEHFKRMLARYETGAVVDDPDDHDDLVALVTAYDRSLAEDGESKCGSGITKFSRERNFDEGWSSDGFHVHRTDGTSIDFSYIKAIRCVSNENK